MMNKAQEKPRMADISLRKVRHPQRAARRAGTNTGYRTCQTDFSRARNSPTSCIYARAAIAAGHTPYCPPRWRRMAVIYPPAPYWTSRCRRNACHRTTCCARAGNAGYSCGKCVGMRWKQKKTGPGREVMEIQHNRCLFFLGEMICYGFVFRRFGEGN